MRLLALFCFTSLLAQQQPVVLGHGAARYTLDLKWAKADPAVAPIVNAHALAEDKAGRIYLCLLYTSPSPRDLSTSRMPSSA